MEYPNSVSCWWVLSPENTTVAGAPVTGVSFSMKELLLEPGYDVVQLYKLGPNSNPTAHLSPGYIPELDTTLTVVGTYTAQFNPFTLNILGSPVLFVNFQASDWNPRYVLGRSAGATQSWL